MPLSYEHLMIRDYLDFAAQELESLETRLSAWEIVLLFYQMVHLIEQFRAEYIHHEFYPKKFNPKLIRENSKSHHSRKDFLNELVSLSEISNNFLMRYNLIEVASKAARYESNTTFVSKYLINCDCSHKRPAGDYYGSDYSKVICLHCKKVQKPSMIKHKDLYNEFTYIFQELKSKFSQINLS
ncbi:MAG: hypothetical protein ACTSYA_13355 [Candidatus Kariarchaeaceae archaeon]